MNVIFVSDAFFAKSEVYNWSGYANLPVVQRMPCDVIVCCSAEEVREHASSADVVLLEGLRAVAFRDELTFLNDLPVFVGAFYTDVWRGPLWADHPVRVDLNISVYKAVAETNLTFRDPDKFLWLPPRVDAPDCDIPRNIDVVHWGALGREYPFRMFVYYTLINLLQGGAKRGTHGSVKVDQFLATHNIVLKEKTYTWGFCSGKRLNPVYYGPKLFEFLHRCKLCPTGPVIQHGISSVVARYFENAACGVISMTTSMEDMDELGFVHGENIWITDGEHFVADLIYLLENPDVVNRMSLQAKEFARTRHSIQVRATKLYEVLSSRTGKA